MYVHVHTCTLHACLHACTLMIVPSSAWKGHLTYFSCGTAGAAAGAAGAAGAILKEHFQINEHPESLSKTLVQSEHLCNPNTCANTMTCQQQLKTKTPEHL